MTAGIVPGKKKKLNEMARDASGADDLYGHIPNLTATIATSDNTPRTLTRARQESCTPVGVIVSLVQGSTLGQNQCE